ncbi:ATP-grasp domain-containing protein [Acidaminobacter sp. JC074]|uniref:ATP-grasp domain-containing protein n=1 Tax=Acidaminobacter sp. JC074 TaxID=2530199 RepID=UPI001F0DD4E6|nr:ATP-grasp domain-containing protein [Acidaminobacter sp. JC074]MCH4888439.1 ATP-grasp domain-containing protein [Acidaminobacter sp. JC074]
MKRIMMLGAGSLQLNAIRRIKEMGHQVVASDYLESSPGKKLSDYAVMADTFSYEETLEGAKKYDIDAIMTTGTDQPVLTAALVSEALGLKSSLSSEQALWVTNKKLMKEIFIKHDIPTVEQVFLKKDFIDIPFDPPYVMKPLDSQGQRGIYKVRSKKEVRDLIGQTLSYSRQDEILLEKFYENQEVTVSGWVRDGMVYVLTITDRVTFSSDEHIGVCLSHEYPTIHQAYLDDLESLTRKICKAFEIENGPIYFQFLIGQEGIMANEIACRIGGAYEDMTIPFVTGFDILKHQIDQVLGIRHPVKVERNNQVFSTQLFFCKPGKISDIKIDALKQEDYIMDIGVNYKIGDVISTTQNASQRAGYMVITGPDEERLTENISKAYDLLEILDEERNLVIRGKRFYR